MAGYAHYELCEDGDESSALSLAVKLFGFIHGQQRAHIGEERRVSKLGPHALLSFGARNGLPSSFKVLAEQSHNTRGIEIRKQRDSLCEVDKVPTLIALEQRAEFGSENFFAAEGDDICLACEPRILDFERNDLGAVVNRALPCGDLDLNADRLADILVVSLRYGFAKCSLLSAVPPRNRNSLPKKSSLKISTKARHMTRSCSTCRSSGHGAFLLHATMFMAGITDRAPGGGERQHSSVRCAQQGRSICQHVLLGQA